MFFPSLRYSPISELSVGCLVICCYQLYIYFSWKVKRSVVVLDALYDGVCVFLLSLLSFLFIPVSMSR